MVQKVEDGELKRKTRERDHSFKDESYIFQIKYLKTHFECFSMFPGIIARFLEKD